MYHAKPRHIEVRYHHIWELVTDKRLELRKVDTEVNIVEDLTNPLLDKCYDTLRIYMRLQQADERKGAESEGAARGSNIGTIEQESQERRTTKRLRKSLISREPKGHMMIEGQKKPKSDRRSGSRIKN